VSDNQRDYREWHQGPDSCCEDYDEKLFQPGRYDYEVWQKEQQLLDGVVERLVPGRERYLDFACGTGRILAHLEPHFRDSVGLDISESMLETARGRVKRAEIICADATREPEAVAGSFDCITAFRFFLNAQPELREEVMAVLASKLRDESSVLVFNVHGNSRSSRWLVARSSWFRDRTYNELGRAAVLRMIHDQGLELVEWHGLQYLDSGIYKWLPSWLCAGIERALNPLGFLTPFAVNLYFVCRRAQPAAQEAPPNG
jgi:SAM-dependent methyltransferase